ncbi:putative sporulation protein YtxC [Cytobacillus horneckiae]|uniref:Putative sporulation protein YtxC n=1 Tax=Cytobacillus horneckiae TaxID=549687 RepID=A0A2N0ZMH0_9BACI|nr:putative sporulation protein YtxC [Cytobacillus horneckiae]MBN6887953.1 putative sporulation protein YtxC [Cytobacillus horneckiae]MCM3179636.1 putative sporulation protein YtxC [Cytobacillus horneckiae]MEC1155081.1 putative sporulation protein YtxC [Cytobacillus horneckiae]MED2936013.1 putative sporulation protein YtxC [Cytobacillus horneckiae]PKG30709.1 putative sporulation protein YtxC [Cytobacillus horneckiae]
MIEIIFQNRNDAEELFHHSTKALSLPECEINILQNEDQHIVRILIGKDDEKVSIEHLKEIFYTFLINSKRDAWFRRIMAENFFYEDEDEQQQILEIIHSILEGEREDLATFVKGFDVQGELRGTIDRMIENDLSFSYDSFVKFRIRPLMEQLTKFVEISIDEYKMEQEYQMFIQTLRDFLTARTKKMDIIHLLIEEGTSFYNSQFSKITRSELTMMIDRRLLFNHPVYIDSVTIAPLLSIAPTSIYLYTNDEDQPLVRTIRNIFEERLTLLPIDAFEAHKASFEKQRIKNIADTP